MAGSSAWSISGQARGVSKDSIKTALTILRTGEIMGIFPEGTRNSDSTAAKRGAASFALPRGATVIPVAIIGDYKLFRKMKIIYGAPVDLSSFEGDKSPEALDAKNRVDHGQDSRNARKRQANRELIYFVPCIKAWGDWKDTTAIMF